MAEFVCWLAGQDVPPGLRRHHHVNAERYLRWQAAGPDPEADRTMWRYFHQLRRAGVGDAELGTIQASIALLQRHRVLAARAEWTCP